MTSSPSLNTIISRRNFLGAASATAVAGYGLAAIGAGHSTADRKIFVGAHPWVYAATQPDYEITLILPQIFADMRYAGLDGIELMHTALRPEALGEGDMDYLAIAKTLREIGFQGDVIIELAHERGFKPTRPLRESLRISRQFVRQTLGY